MNKKANSLTCGIVSLAMSAVSLLIFGWLSISGLLVAIGGLATEIKSRKEGEGNQTGLILCIVGIVVSIVAMVLYFMTIAKIAGSVAQ